MFIYVCLSVCVSHLCVHTYQHVSEQEENLEYGSLPSTFREKTGPLGGGGGDKKERLENNRRTRAVE